MNLKTQVMRELTKLPPREHPQEPRKHHQEPREGPPDQIQTQR